MMSHSSKMPGDARQKRTISMRPQLEQLDQRICFSIDLPQVLVEQPSPDVPAEISTYVEVNIEWNDENDKGPHDSQSDEQQEDSSNDSPDESELEASPWDSTDKRVDGTCVTLSHSAEAGRFESYEFYSSEAPTDSAREAWPQATPPTEVLDTALGEPIVSAGLNSNTNVPAAIPVVQIGNNNFSTPSATPSSLPLIQPVPLLPLQTQDNTNNLSLRRDISSLVGNQPDTQEITNEQSRDLETNLSQHGDKAVESDYPSNDLNTPVVAMTGLAMPPRSTRFRSADASLPLVSDVPTLAVESVQSAPPDFSEPWFVQPTELGLIQQAIFQSEIATDQFDGLSDAEVEEVLGTDAALAKVLAGVSLSRDASATENSSEDQQTKLSENSYRLLIAGLIALPTSTRGKEILRWIRRNKPKNTEP